MRTDNPVRGWRSGEVTGLRWAEINIARRTATPADSKTGRSMRPLSHAACTALPKRGSDELIFLAARGNKATRSFTRTFRSLASLGELPGDITPHVLRHSFASLAADLGYPEPTIATLLGHSGGSVTSRYVHGADSVLLAAADAVADRISELMGELRATGKGVQLRPEETVAVAR